MISRDEAYALVTERIPQPNLISHCVATEVLMGAVARQLGQSDTDIARWEIAGLLHDLDYAETADDPVNHGLVTADLLAGELDDEQIHAILAHAGKAPRESLMDHALWCTDPTTGFIVAAALVRAEKKLSAVEVSSLKKRWKEKAFARGADREQMAGHEALGLEREQYLAMCLAAMQARSDELGL